MSRSFDCLLSALPPALHSFQTMGASNGGRHRRGEDTDAGISRPSRRKHRPSRRRHRSSRRRHCPSRRRHRRGQEIVCRGEDLVATKKSSIAAKTPFLPAVWLLSRILPCWFLKRVFEGSPSLLVVLIHRFFNSGLCAFGLKNS